ncbi:hypothetical protein GCM10027176_41630 [Actinoallomurus bryophytorum]|uniref:hypothetical protein n=1 Tax=Actinoallomurus bryophytorum TaxID=1490222 RepID=UPI00163A1B80|nr:hypothetical protein [Actinoallomurus bryophytorum]
MVDVVVLSDDLLAEMAGYGRTLVAFSGGVVLTTATPALGTGQIAAVSAVSPSLPALN